MRMGLTSWFVRPKSLLHGGISLGGHYKSTSLIHSSVVSVNTHLQNVLSLGEVVAACQLVSKGVHGSEALPTASLKV